MRYNDLNIFNEVDLSQYLEYVITSRWHTARDRFGLNASDFLKRGVAFFMKRAEMDFVHPIKGGQSVIARSWVSAISSDKSQLIVPFEITSPNGSITFAKGTLYFTIMDVASGKPKRGTLPDWVIPIFWEAHLRILSQAGDSNFEREKKGSHGQ